MIFEFKKNKGLHVAWPPFVHTQVNRPSIQMSRSSMLQQLISNTLLLSSNRIMHNNDVKFLSHTNNDVNFLQHLSYVEVIYSFIFYVRKIVVEPW
jgi:hypothetical protein